MKLGNIKKLITSVAEKLSLPSNVKQDNPSIAPLSTKVDQTAIVLKERKHSVRIQCWSCSNSLWVMKGSQCHIWGLCSRCTSHFNPKTNKVEM